MSETWYKEGPYDRYKWSYNLYKWPYKWVTGVITLLIGVITPFITESGAHLVVPKKSLGSEVYLS